MEQLGADPFAYPARCHHQPGGDGDTRQESMDDTMLAQQDDHDDHDEKDDNVDEVGEYSKLMDEDQFCLTLARGISGMASLTSTLS